MARLFVAVYPNSAAIEALLALRRPDTPGVRWVPPENWHVTLRFLGSAEPDAVSEVLGEMRAERTIARCSGPLGRLGRDALVVRVRGLERVASDVARCTAAFGRSADRRPFDGHLTVARLRRWDRSGLTDLTMSASWRVDEVVLVESQLRPTGAVHTVVSRHSLAATGS